MSIYNDGDENIPSQTEVPEPYSEKASKIRLPELACEEEIYLEEAEESRRAILTSDDPSPSPEACYEKLACQEEVYLEEAEEQRRAIETSDDPS